MPVAAACHPGDAHQRAQSDTAHRAAAEEHDRDAPGLVGEGALQAGCTTPRVHPHAFGRGRQPCPSERRQQTDRVRVRRQCDSCRSSARTKPEPGPLVSVARSSPEWHPRPTPAGAEVVGHDRDVAVRHARQRRGDRRRRPVVQEAVPAARVLAPRDQHGQLGPAVGRRARPPARAPRAGRAVGALDDVEREPRQAELAATPPSSSSVFQGSRSKCTARRSSAVSVRAYCRARAAAASSSSTRTMTAWRRRTGASAQRRGVLLQLLASSASYALLRRTRPHDHDRDEQHDDPGALGELHEATMTSTRNDSSAPMPLIHGPTFQPGSFWRTWCLAMPACDSVKLVNTPIA